MSHLSYQRKLPLTYAYLRDTLKAVILDGYNIVGDATTAALIPITTGKCRNRVKTPRPYAPDLLALAGWNECW